MPDHETQVLRETRSHVGDAAARQLRGLEAHGERARTVVLTHARHQLAKGRDPQAVLEYLAHTLTNRVLHAPTAALRMATIENDANLMRAVERLFPATDTAGGSGEAPPPR